MKTGILFLTALFIIFTATPGLCAPVTLVTVGDSLTAGDGDDGMGGGYPARLLNLLLPDYPESTLSNRAISGDTTNDLIAKQLVRAILDLNSAPAGSQKIALIWIGSNDLFGLYNSDVCTEYYPDLPTCESYEMEDSCTNVNNILGSLKATGASVYIALLDDQTKRPVIANETLRNETFPGITFAEVGRMATQLNFFNEQTATHADTHGAETVDFFTTTIFETPALLSDDGNHPNGAGYDAIAQIWFEALDLKSATDPPVPGNIDGSADGRVTLADAVSGLQVLSGLFSSEVDAGADVNGNQQIDLAEVIYALRTVAGPIPDSGGLVQPENFTYLGAFRLPGDDTKPKTFAYGGNAMTCNPDGDGGNGSLYIMGHDRQAWGELPDGGQVAEIRPAVPVKSKIPADLNTATFLQNFTNVATGYFSDLEELPRIGMAYLNHPDTGPKIHIGWGQHHKPDTLQPTYAWFSPTLDTPNLQGLWYIGNQDWYSINGYIFDIPAAWADAHTGGRYLATGRAMDGGWGGMGPCLLAYCPWEPDGSPATAGTHLSVNVLLLYEDTQVNGDTIQHTVQDYQHPDEWEGGAWITTDSGLSSVLFIANKGTGEKYWYGYRHPDGPECPCVNTQAASEFTACRMADGSPCPAEDMIECDNHTSAKGWWCSQFTPRLVLYDSSDLAKVAAGTMDSWEPQPYAHLDIGEHMLFNPANVDLEMLGEGVQRRYLFGDAAYNEKTDRLYVLELFADEAKPVVHVWQIQ